MSSLNPSDELLKSEIKAKLVLSTGDVLDGVSIGAPVTSSGELVFTTGMVGYGEALTDPSYCGQIINFTFPQIGNYGLPEITSSEPTLGFESSKTFISGAIVTKNFNYPQHRTSQHSLSAWLKKNGIPGLAEVDTRHLTHLIRHHGKILARIIPENSSGYLNRPALGFNESILPENQFFDPTAYNLLNEVSNTTPTLLGSGDILVNVVNFGVKWNIIRRLISNNCRVRLLPWNAKFSDYLDADAWVLSNGPGDPAVSNELIQQVRFLIENKSSVLGICLGHQLLSLAAGAKTERLHYGHRSHNQPVRQLQTKKGFITSQNHGFVVVKNSLSDDWETWFENINDDSIEGIKHKNLIIRSVQFHPEASSGPKDTSFIIDDFCSEVRALKADRRV